MWNLRPDERLHEWRQFRAEIGTLDLGTALDQCSNLWSYAPYVTHYLAEDLVSEWPDPWALVYENYYCDLAKALGMLYTLYLCPHYAKSIRDLELRIYKNPTEHDILNTVWVNRGKYILNLKFNTVVNKTQVDENLILRHRYRVQDLKLEQY